MTTNLNSLDRQGMKRFSVAMRRACGLFLSACFLVAAVAQAQITPAASTPSGTSTVLPTGMSSALAPGGVVPVAPTLLRNAAPPLRDGVPSDNQSATKAVVRDAPPLAVTEYQKFVQESTGQFLPLYGYNLFEGGNFPSVQNVPVPTDYVLGPGDEVQLKLWGSIDGDMRLVVDRNGQISIPRVGTVNVAGVKVSQLESVLRGQVSRVYNNYQLSATLGQLRSIQVFVVGQARRPGAYTLSSLSTLISALFESGGPSSNGTMRNIQLKREGRIVSTIDLYRFINEGDKSADAKLLPGDVIVIPPAGARVALTGALDTPAVYELAALEEPFGKVVSYGGRTLSLTTPH
jgi:protein involved in polysaccharide export with SLBB domain